MNISNLKPGQSFTNYKELCKALELPVKAGKGKDLQLAEIKRFIDLEKNPHKQSYIVYEIREFPLPKLRRKGNKIDGLYFSLVGFLVSRTDMNNIVTRVTLSSSKLHLLLGFCNDNYFYYKDNFEKFLELLASDDISFRDMLKEYKVDSHYVDGFSVELAETEEAFKVFYKEGREVMYKTLGRILQAMYESEIILVEEKSQVKREKNGEFKWATPDEYTIIRTFRGVIYTKLECKHYGQVIKEGKSGIFERELKLMLGKEGIFDTRRYYEFSFTKELVKIFESYKQVYSGVDFTRLEANIGIQKALEKDEAEFRKICIDNFILLEDNVNQIN